MGWVEGMLTSEHPFGEHLNFFFFVAVLFFRVNRTLLPSCRGGLDSGRVVYLHLNSQLSFYNGQQQKSRPTAVSTTLASSFVLSFSFRRIHKNAQEQPFTTVCCFAGCLAVAVAASR